MSPLVDRRCVPTLASGNSMGFCPWKEFCSGLASFLASFSASGTWGSLWVPWLMAQLGKSHKRAAFQGQAEDVLQ